MAISNTFADNFAKGIGAKCADGWKMVVGTLAHGGDNYATGGISLDLSAQFRSGAPSLVLVESQAGLIASYDYTAKKVKIYYADYDGTADGALIEHPASALTVTLRYIAFGA